MVEVKEITDAKKEPIDKAGALELARANKRIVAARGKSVVEVDMSANEVSDDEIAKLIVGPSGKLRAPTLRINKTLIVGFNDEMYTKEIG